MQLEQLPHLDEVLSATADYRHCLIERHAPPWPRPVLVLVNDAASTGARRYSDPAAAIKDWIDIIAVNLDGMFNVTHAFLATLRATKLVSERETAPTSTEAASVDRRLTTGWQAQVEA
jgi:hypothetical protein